MRSISELIDFLNHTMDMSEVYQPAIIRYLLEAGGQATKEELASVLSGYDDSVQDYYQKIVMRWPRITLTKHNIVFYDKVTKTFYLNFDLSDATMMHQAKLICEERIERWIDERTPNMESPHVEAAKRYKVLQAAKGKCQLCGISSKLAPIEIDHIVPQSQADRHGNIIKDGITMNVHDERNLQALCFRCNRAKRDTDATDFRQSSQKLVRDLIPAIINTSGRNAVVQQLTGQDLQQALMEKLIEEHAELIADTNIEEIADMMEVLISLAGQLGFNEEETLSQVTKKRLERGGFEQGWFLVDIISE